MVPKERAIQREQAPDVHPGPMTHSLLSTCLQESGEKLHPAREAETNSRGVADEQVLELAQGEVVGMGSSPRVQT